METKQVQPSSHDHLSNAEFFREFRKAFNQLLSDWFELKRSLEEEETQ